MAANLSSLSEMSPSPPLPRRESGQGKMQKGYLGTLDLKSAEAGEMEMQGSAHH